MIKVEVPRDRDKFCLNCNCYKEDCKELKFSVGSNDSCFTAICLCKNCRDQLKNLLSQEVVRNKELVNAGVGYGT